MKINYENISNLVFKFHDNLEELAVDPVTVYALIYFINIIYPLKVS